MTDHITFASLLSECEELSAAVLDYLDARKLHGPASPEAQAGRAAVRDIGERLHERGGIQAMQDAHGYIIQRQGPRTANIVDRAWNRIGAEGGGVWLT